MSLWISSFAIAQQIYFPQSVRSDTAILENEMPVLAKHLIGTLAPGSDQIAYLRNMVTLQIISKEYADAISTVHSLRKLQQGANIKFPDLYLIQYEVFCQAKIKEASGQLSFEEAYENVFHQAFDRLGDREAHHISTAFISRNGLNDLQQNFARSLSQIKGDSIGISDAIALCRNYNVYSVFRVIEPLSSNMLQAEDNKRYEIDDSIKIRTRDGATISAIVVRSRQSSAPQPSILQFTIYARPDDLRRVRDAAANGYIGIIAYTRGKRFSPNEIIPYEYDGKDAYDVIDWIVKQPWSNGKVGMFGGSYNGFTTWAATKNLHPALKTIVPSASVAPGLDVPMTNNVFMSFTFPWIYYVTNNKFLDEDDYNQPVWNTVNDKWYASGRPYRRLDSILGRGTNKVFQRWLDHPTYDKYWQDMIPYKQDFSKINIPVLSTTGYYDGGQIGATYYLREHLKYNKKAIHYLLIGPYGHFGSQSIPDAIYNGYAIDSVANISIHDIIFQWFDYILKDSSKPALLKDKINFEVMGANQWLHSSTLSSMSNHKITFYLSNIHADNHYKLSEQIPMKKEFLEQKVDFSDRKSVNLYYHASQVIYDSLDISNGISFVSEPLKEELMINGSFAGEIKASINKKDMDFSLNLYEWMPDGRFFYLSYFMGRASYANDKSRRQLLQPGRITAIPFTNTYITSKKLSKGSRIVIVLNINKSSYEQINYGSGKDVSDESIQDARIPLTVRWYTDSFINIPVWK